MKSVKLRILSISLIVLLAVTTSGLVFGAWFLKKWEQQVTEKFEGQKWRFPSKVYSDSYLLYVGINLRLDDLAEKLRRLGYYETQSAPKSKGEYRVAKADGAVDIFLHDFSYPTEQVKGFPVRIVLHGNFVSRIENPTNGKEMFSLELEPELVTGLYKLIWQERRVVKLSEVPPLLIKSILAIEDERFYSHHGVDPIGVLRAMWVNLRSFSFQQGGSTLTQQLMKNFLLTDERTLTRKIPEAVMALIAERKYSKDVILENYLNEIYLGQRGSQGIFGVWEAAQFYFSKPLSDLTVGESALLAGLIRAPNRLSPYKSAEAATKRRNVVLGKLLDDQIINRKQYDTALREKLPQRALAKVTNDAPFYVDYLRRELEQNYSNDVLTQEGLRIFTSLDLQLQRIADRALTEGLKKLEASHPALKKKGADDSLEGAIIVLRPQTGEIKAMIGGRNYQKSQFNRVFQARRQPGSIFKPFVYLAALMYGGQSGVRYTPDTVLNDSQFTWSYDGQEWQPNNYNNEYFGAVTFRRALESSLNSATGRVAQDVGIRRVRDLAYRLGIQSPLPTVPSLALGSAEVTPLEVAVAFSTLANNGVRTRPLAVKQVIDQNTKVLEKRDVRVEQVVSPQLANAMNQLLKGVLDRGTATGARRLGFTRPAAGKTGTTNDYKDAWFVGYTPDLLAVVWVGFDGQSKLNLSGADAALPIWTEFMKAATASMPVTDFVGPPMPNVEGEETPAAAKCVPAGKEGESASERCPPGTVPARTPSEVL
ncbi:MAG TPA: PBP1A family penicillin-binding protein [Candidatus Saccharimonadales bacterium]|nr:PBP1A family penicillin-binding protein [Candidatus Saccharimonadales bacterium]